MVKKIGTKPVNGAHDLVFKAVHNRGLIWRVYLTGSYTPDCCPNYLKPENFESLHANVGRVRTHNATVSHFLKEHPGAGGNRAGAGAVQTRRRAASSAQYRTSSRPAAVRCSYSGTISIPPTSKPR